MRHFIAAIAASLLITASAQAAVPTVTTGNANNLTQTSARLHGTVKPNKSSFSFTAQHASLFDSSLLTFTLTGDMAARVGWGDEKVFVVSVGGFHPAFHEVPSDLTGLRRLTIALLSGDNPRLVAQTYFAVTSNTVQSGSRVELYAAAGAWLGPANAAWLGLYAGVAGFVMALVVALYSGYLRKALSNIWFLLQHWTVNGIRPLDDVSLEGSSGPRLAYALPIFAGLVMAIWLH